jgi:hypothetical protein
MSQNPTKSVLKYRPSSILVSDPILREIVKKVSKLAEEKFNTEVPYDIVESCVIHEFKVLRSVLMKGDPETKEGFAESAWLEGLGSFILSKNKLKYFLNKKKDANNNISSD